MVARPARTGPVSLLRLLPVLLALGLLCPPPGFAAGHPRRDPAPKIAPGLLARMAASPNTPLPVILEMDRAGAPKATGAQLAREALRQLRRHGKPVGGLALIGGAAGWATAADIQLLSQLREVAAIHYDAAVRPRRPERSDGDPAPDRSPPARPARGHRPPPADGAPAPGDLLSLYPREVNADRVWQQGDAGRGVTVAVLDSGIARDPDLTRTANRILAAVSFAGPRDPLQPDPGGHGSHIAGTIAGDGASSDREYVGIAPRADLVDVRVLNRNGNGRLSSVIRGIEWVVGHAARYHIRVINLSFGADAELPYQLDPLAAAVEIAWQRGLVVVAAAGNGGPNQGSVQTPGIDPYVITVGATDDHGTPDLARSTLAWFSGWGTATGSVPKPDLIAPGRRIVSLRVPGSALDTLLPDHVVQASNGATYFRLTGTSMATAVVSGAAALLLQRQPRLTPDQVKAILTATTQPFGQQASAPPPGAAGAGLLDASAATDSPVRAVANRGLRPADALARTLYPALFGQPLVWKNPSYLGIDWSSQSWDNIAWDNIAWDNIAWDNIAWDNIAWDNIAWDNIAWDNIAWDNIAWDNIAWDGLALD